MLVLLIGQAQDKSPHPAQTMAESKGSEVEVHLVHPDASMASSDTKYTVIDVRGVAERYAGMIPGTIHVHLDEIVEDASAAMERVHTLVGTDKNSPLLVHCRSGRRSLRACNLLAKAGFTDVSNMEGGISEWASKGLVTVAADDMSAHVSVDSFVDAVLQAWLDHLVPDHNAEGEAEATELFREVLTATAGPLESIDQEKLQATLGALGHAAKKKGVTFDVIASETEKFLRILTKVRSLSFDGDVGGEA